MLMCVMAGVMNVDVNVCIDVDKESCCKDGGGPKLRTPPQYLSCTPDTFFLQY